MVLMALKYRDSGFVSFRSGQYRPCTRYINELSNHEKLQTFWRRYY